jgi:hypothetical protein
MAFAKIVFTTSGYSIRSFTTTGGGFYFLTNAQANAFFSTVSDSPLLVTSAISTAFLSTVSGVPFYVSSKIDTAFFVTPDPNVPRELVLKIGPLTIDSDYVYVTVPDATGLYSTSNPGGYNIIPGPYNPYRPYRLNVHLWTVCRIWNVYGDETQNPDTQPDEDEDPYSYNLQFPTTTDADGNTEIVRGVYEIILIAAPFFNETNSGGLYLFDSEITYRLLEGTEGSTFNLLEEGDWLYQVSSANGELLPLKNVDKVITNTLVNLSADPDTTPVPGQKLYGSGPSISGMKYSNGYVDNTDGYTSGQYKLLTGVDTIFESGLFLDDYIYYLDVATGNYILIGRALDIISETAVNINSLTGNIPSTGDLLFKSGVDVDNLVNSGGTFDSIDDVTIYGVDTDFDLFNEGDTLYYQDAATKNLFAVGVIDTIVSATELTLTEAPVVVIGSGDRLFASIDPFVTFNSLFGTVDSLGPELTYHALKGFNTTFSTSFVEDDYIYIVAEDGTYKLLGQVDSIYSDTIMLFYTPEDIEVNAFEYIWGNENELNLIDLVGDIVEYTTGSAYEVLGSPSCDFNQFEPEQYLFYFSNDSGRFVKMGKIKLIYDVNTVWLYEPLDGNVTDEDGLYSSWSLNTETADYSQYKGNKNLYDVASQYPGWYVTSVGLLVDDLLINCLTRKRYEFLQQVMCGKCPTEYLYAYGIYVSLINAIEIKDWTSAVTLYNKLKEICAAWESSCGC